MQTVDVLRYIIDADTSGLRIGSQKAEAAVRTLGQNIKSQLTEGIKGAITAIVGYQSLRLAATFAQEAAQAQRVATSWRSLADSAGLNAAKVLGELKQVSRGTIDEVDLMMQASRASIMGLPMKDLPELMRISRAAAKAFGQDTGFMFESIVLGIARQSRLILDNLGIIIDEEALYKRETQRLGHELSEVEKKQAFFNEALRQGQRIVEKVGSDTGDYADEIASFNVQWKEMRRLIGGAILETGAMQGINTLLNFLDKFPPFVEAARILSEAWHTFWRLPEDVWAMVKGQLSLMDWLTGNRPKTPVVTMTMIPGLMPAHDPDYFVKLQEKWRTQAIELEEIYYSLGQRTTAQMIALYEDMAEAYKDNTEKKEAAEKRLHELKLKHIEEEIIAEQSAATRGAFRMPAGTGSQPTSGAPVVDTRISEDWYGPQSQISVWRRMWGAINDESNSGAQFLVGIFQGLWGQLSGVASEAVGGIVSMAYGDWKSAGESVVNILIAGIDHFFGHNIEMAQRTEQAMERAREATEQFITSLDALTDAQKESKRQTLEYLIAQAQQDMANARARGLDYDFDLANAQIYEWTRQLNALMGVFADDAAIRGIKNFQDLLNYFTGNATTLDYQTGRSLIDHFAEMFDLTAEQQIQLYQMLLDILQASGNLTTEQQWAIERTLKNLRDAGLTEDSGGSQISRSITAITQTQANLMLGVLNTMSYYLREILETIRNMSLPTGGIGLASVNIGAITINASGQAEGVAAARGLAMELRARGIKLGVPK